MNDSAKKSVPNEREARVAAALRENLRKRKEQQKAREQQGEEKSKAGE